VGGPVGQSPSLDPEGIESETPKASRGTAKGISPFPATRGSGGAPSAASRAEHQPELNLLSPECAKRSHLVHVFH